MADRLDALVAREYADRDGNKKTAFTKIGVAFATKNGGWSLSLEALPLPTMGERGLETRILLMVPKPREDRPSQRQERSTSYDRDDARTQGGSIGRDLDDEIPFAPEFR